MDINIDLKMDDNTRDTIATIAWCVVLIAVAVAVATILT